MSNKVIDLDPRKRLTKEALEAIKASIAKFTIDDLECLFVAYRSKEEGPKLEAFGADWTLLGFSQACLDHIRSQVFDDEIGDDVYHPTDHD